MHYTRWLNNGDPLVVKRRGAAFGSSHPNWGGGSVSYEAVHNRLRRSRGSAREWWCEHCDNRAAQWAYDYKDPDEKIDPRKNRRYSTDLGHYFSLCADCHIAFDHPRRTHCGKGHVMDEANTYIEPKTGYPMCRTCRRDTSRRFYEKQRSVAR